MATPTLHSHSAGIHPGAYVSPTAPLSPSQNHVLWVDTSAGPPYALRLWDASTGKWLVVGTTGLAGNDPQPGHHLTVDPTGTGTVWEPACCDTGPVLTIPGGGSPTGGSTAVQYLCGAADAMTEELANWYKGIQWALNALVSLGSGIALTAVIAAIAAALGVSETGIPAWISLPFLTGLAQWLISALSGGVIPSLTRDDTDQILQDLFCVLPRGSTTVTITSKTLSDWSDELYVSPGPMDPLKIDLLSRLLKVALPVKWQSIAAAGAAVPTTLCDDFTCSGGSMSGGAVIGLLTLQSMSGGASYEIQGLNSISGGAILLTNDGNSLSGGVWLKPVNGYSLSGGALIN